MLTVFLWEADLIQPVFRCFFVALDVSANCICEMHCLALDGFDLNNVHKLSSKEKSSADPSFEPGAAELEARMLPQCYVAAQFCVIAADWSTLVWEAYFLFVSISFYKHSCGVFE